MQRNVGSESEASFIFVVLAMSLIGCIVVGDSCGGRGGGGRGTPAIRTITSGTETSPQTL